MSITKGVDTYATIQDADDIIQERFDIDNWTNADTTTREKALKLATKHIDSADYRFQKYDREQPLKFPRNVYMYHTQSTTLDEIPKQVVEATCLEALSILDGRENDNVYEKLLSAGIKSQRIEGTSVSFADGVIKAKIYESQILSKEAQSLLSTWTVKSYRRG